MPAITSVAWQTLPYPPFWQNSSNNPAGGQQVTPDCNYLLMWQTGATTGGNGRLAVFSLRTLTWSGPYSFPGANQPHSWSTLVAGFDDTGAPGLFFAFIDQNANDICYVNTIGPNPALSGQQVTSFDLVNQASLSGIGYNSARQLPVLNNEPPLKLWGVYGSALSSISNAMMQMPPCIPGQKNQFAIIYPTSDIALAGQNLIGSTSIGQSGNVQGNDAQRWLPGRIYFHDPIAGPSPTNYFDKVTDKFYSLDPSHGVVRDASFWVTSPATGILFPSIIYGRIPTLFDKTNTNFEQTLTDLSFGQTSPYLNFDSYSYVKPGITGSIGHWKLANVTHVPFNLKASLFGIPIQVNTPANFTSDNWSIWEMGGTTFILDDLGNFYMLALAQYDFQFHNLVNWHRLIQPMTARVIK